ncbi:hypothetical protein [Aneurinibacillus thermoaerophilus]|uniref:Uncharacterized protein n=1 Tax=Aneurinibacillus thermoaerophilus TaxID=143495 RepID=A0ABX8YEA4_ANETH|nr:hypothetical protein [Aneurinibacillus thermoaerophilus]MED0676237.1 hypothetical protein [Aneurinibacillus thermoaerophilus]MED0678169.1 hypothetical protein [Aneurinibacillus thermoaerophilus]MED0737645.1 hypothetical protein [Aneurinibacillus thermoaerophilus]MED0765648.1 hypothetical protein [Aneurinibacillus thermoaerophilus]QYY43434.1 hypothetical protein K3F53_04065 [Aneurinibacillus thermoaerophilus]
MRNDFRHIIYLIFAFLLVLYSLPRLPLLRSQTEAVLFSVIWLAFALLIIGSQLYQIIDGWAKAEQSPLLAMTQDEQKVGRTQPDYE